MSLLRELVGAAMEASGGRLEIAVVVAAYRFRRLGGSISNQDRLTPVEIAALEVADERIRSEDAIRLARAILEGPASIGATLDGGEARRRGLLRSALAQVRESMRAEVARKERRR